VVGVGFAPPYAHRAAAAVAVEGALGAHRGASRPQSLESCMPSPISAIRRFVESAVLIRRFVESAAPFTPHPKRAWCTPGTVPEHSHRTFGLTTTAQHRAHLFRPK